MAEKPAAAGAAPKFVHLRARTPYSLLEGAIRIPELADLCVRHDMPAVGITDTGNLFGAMEVSDKIASAGVQPIVGCTLSIELPEKELKRRDPRARKERLPALAFLAQNEEGYGNLMKLSSKAFLETDPALEPHLGFDALDGLTDGLICLTGGPGGPLNRLLLSNKTDEAAALLDRLQALFPGRLYVELQRHGLEEEERAEGPLLDLAYGRDLPIVATNEPFFATRDMHEAHDVLVCIAEGAYRSDENRRTLTAEHYFKSQQEMAALFADLPEALERTVEIARRCAYRPLKVDPILPPYETDSGRSEADELRAQAEEGLRQRLAEFGTHRPEADYWKRLDYELGIINSMGFPGYFLIVSDFMKWARAEQIPIGVRGSGATSIVAWAMSITNLDPLRFDLVFERFLNPERISMPDFDIDFCQERRAEVIAYVQRKYGIDNVAQIITFGTLQARAAVRDVGRVLSMPYGKVDGISKMIPAPPGKSVKLSDAIAEDPKLRQMIEDDADVAKLMEIAQKLEGLYRHASTHAAGLVIGDRPLTELVPLYRDPRADMPVTQFHWKDVEKAGLVKFDFLGLKTLTVIAKTEELLGRRGIELDTQSLPFEDARAFELLSRGDSIGVFQLESTGMRDLLRQMKPDRIEDLIALVALYRPGPMDSIPRYIACKHGREKPHYAHPMLEPLLNETFGVMTYQEDVMRVARDMAGYSLGEADLLRRAMGKKIQAEMDKHRVKFVEGAGEKGVPREVADSVFDQAAKFAGYGFNKGHAAAYAQVAYQTAYLKANYPVEFIAASMTLDIERTDKLNLFRQEAARLGIEVRPPDVNLSHAIFVPQDDPDPTSAKLKARANGGAGPAGDGANGPHADDTGGNAAPQVIYYALGAIRNVGIAAMDHVVAERAANGPFADPFDFAKRVDPRLVNKRAFEGLVKAGAFDSLHANRAQLLAAVDLLMDHATAAAQERASSQMGMFGGEEEAVNRPRLPEIDDWPPMERLGYEMDMVGFYLSGHPLDEFAAALRRKRVVQYGDLVTSPARPDTARLAGSVISRQEKKSRTGASFAFVSLSDPSGIYEAMAFSEVLATKRDMLEPGRRVVLSVGIRWGEEGPRLAINDVETVETAAAGTVPTLRVFLDDPQAVPGVKACLVQEGKSKVALILMPEDGRREIEIDLGRRFGIDARTAAALKSTRGVVHVEEI